MFRRDNSRIGASYLGRLSTLADHGLLHRLPNGVYAISEKGEAYLEGEYDAEAEEFIENPDEYGIGSTEPGGNGA